MDRLRLVSGGSGLSVVVSGKDKGVKRIAQTLVDDIRTVADPVRGSVRVIRSLTVDDPAAANSKVIIVAGIVGEDKTYDEFASSCGAELGLIKGKRECYLIRYVPAGSAALSATTYAQKDIILVFGSDKLGCEYGLLYISSLIGVSPWHYWGDVVPEKQSDLQVAVSDLNIISKEPSVEYRGFFLNDEWPSLGSWVSNTFGRFDENFYATVFDLLLRMRGNFMWPAMWAEVFGEDGTAYPEAIADLATDLGITMGTSHHEPLFRAGEEFTYHMTDSNDIGYGKDWSYYTNERGIYKFWEDGVKRDKDHKALITIGMRGERDSLLLGADATMKDNVDLLKKAITDQKKILADNGLADAPQVLALYKEVEDYYYGDKDTEGLNNWDVLDDTLLLLSDDNFGNLRSVPSPETKDRPAGWGIYYHLDYHGDPISYEWVNSTPIAKMWEQLTTAYEYGIRRLWIVNVGDLRPVEMPLQYFLDLAFDIEKYSEPNITYDYMRNWARTQFPKLSGEDLERVTELLHEYTRFNGDRRPEATHPDTFSFTEEREALCELERAEGLFAKADEVASLMPAEYRDRFYGFVEFPCKASANLRRMMLLTGAYDIAASKAVGVANAIKDAVDQTIALDKELVRCYNEEMSNGKWRGMMSSKHVDFKHWNDEDSVYPDLSYVGTSADGSAIVTSIGDGAVSSYADDAERDAAIVDFLESISSEHADDVIIFKADEFTSSTEVDGSSWQVIDDYGKSGVSVKLYPLCKDYADPALAPSLKFDLDIKTEGEYKVTVYTAPSNNPFKGKGLRFAVAVDDGDAVVLDTLPEGYMAGYGTDKDWCKAVLENGRRTTCSFNLKAGHHELRFIHMDAGIVLQKIEVATTESKAFYGYRK